MTPEAARQLADLGAWPLLILLVGLILVGAIRKWWVPGYLYQELRDDWKILRDQGDRNSKALELLATHEHPRKDGG